jgi:hypothetical protein
MAISCARSSKSWALPVRAIQRTSRSSAQAAAGNVYTVTIDKKPKCTCPDMIKNSVCKHMIFIWVRVLGLNPSVSPFWYQRGLLLSELAEIFATARQPPHDPQADAIRHAYRVATGQEGAEAAPAEQGDKKKPLEDDSSCPVCYEVRRFAVPWRALD